MAKPTTHKQPSDTCGPSPYKGHIGYLSAGVCELVALRRHLRCPSSGLLMGCSFRHYFYYMRRRTLSDREHLLLMCPQATRVQQRIKRPQKVGICCAIADSQQLWLPQCTCRAAVTTEHPRTRDTARPAVANSQKIRNIDKQSVKKC